MSSATWTQLAPGYRTGSLGPLTVVVQEEDGYINATKLCKDAHKNLKNWTRNKDSLALIDAAAELAGIEINDLRRKVNNGPRCVWGTYCHPVLITHIAYWISPTFGAQVSLWIEEWKLMEGNAERYFEALSTMTPYQNSSPEADVCAVLVSVVGGEREVRCRSGRIDLLTDYCLVEVKCLEGWMAGLGQLICYGSDHPCHRKVMYVYDGRLSSHSEQILDDQGISVAYSVKDLLQVERRQRRHCRVTDTNA